MSVHSPQGLIGEQILAKAQGRVLVPILQDNDTNPQTPVMVRSGGQPDSVLRIYRAELLYDPDRHTETVAPIQLEAESVGEAG